MKEIHSVLVACLIATVFMLLATDSEQKSKVRKISEISEFSYLAVWENSKSRKILHIFSSERDIHSFQVTSSLGSYFHAFSSGIKS